MNYFLAKSEPGTYSIDQFAKDKTTTWNGVKNPTAVQFLKKMQPGDKVFFYHSGESPQIVGLAEVIGNSRPDPQESRSWLVDFKFLKKFKTPITLKEIKESGKFAKWRLVYQSRLSTMDVPQEFIQFLKKQGQLHFD